MTKFLNSFKDKRFKYGTFSTLTAIFVIGILLVVNLVFSQLNLSYDLTKDKMYSLTDDTKVFLAKVNEDVNVYPLFKTGASDSYVDTFTELLDEYPVLNSKIKVEYKDPYLYPQFVEKYSKEGEEITPGSIIVESNRRFKVIPKDKLVTEEMNYETYQSYVSSIDIEPQITNAIKYVTDEKTNVIYQIKNHNELEIPTEFKSQMETGNYEIRDLDLLMTETVPEDCNLLLVTTPERDWAPDEAEKVMNYLKNDGRAIFFVDFVGYSLDNLKSVLSSYGVEFEKGIVCEADASHLYRGNPFYLIPDFATHDITKTFVEKKYKMLVPGAVALKEMSLKKNSIKVEPLLVTTNSAYSKVNPEAESTGKEQGDIDGPFNLAVAVTDSYYTEKQHYTKIIAMGSSSLITNETNAVTGGSNVNFVMDSINWTQDKSDTIYVTPKTSQSTKLTMDYGQALGLMVFASIILPAGIFVTGFVVWLRRRNS